MLKNLNPQKKYFIPGHLAPTPPNYPETIIITPKYRMKEMGSCSIIHLRVPESHILIKGVL